MDSPLLWFSSFVHKLLAKMDLSRVTCLASQASRRDRGLLVFQKLVRAAWTPCCCCWTSCFLMQCNMWWDETPELQWSPQVMVYLRPCMQQTSFSCGSTPGLTETQEDSAAPQSSWQLWGSMWQQRYGNRGGFYWLGRILSSLLSIFSFPHQI